MSIDSFQYVTSFLFVRIGKYLINATPGVLYLLFIVDTVKSNWSVSVSQRRVMPFKNCPAV